FGGYIEENFLALHQAQGLTSEDIYKLARNAFNASFLDQAQKKKYLNELDVFVSKYHTANRITCITGRHALWPH
ncbi:MAG: hypothetical protein JRF60_18540, partial [Deltaproteobacteria bacterium]|nr:hypothetical protein [Deltaproteobacteria bacterium]